MREIKVLDHGFIRLIDSMGSDLAISRNARVSYNSDWRAGEDKGSDTRLIKYLYKNGHNTPFESVELQFDVKAPIFVLRQWMRHRTQSYNEVSARYTILPREFYVPEEGVITAQSEDNKQMRTDSTLPNSCDIQELIYLSCSRSYQHYEELLKQGCPRELARGVLPGNMYSHMFVKVDLSNLFKFLKERLHEHAQYEIRVYAEAIIELIEPVAPVAVGIFKEELNGR